jgi:hypothetical protein
MTFAPSAVIGGLVSMSGIVMGNAAIWKMMDAYDGSISERREMFSTGEEVNPGNKRVEAGKWYRETHPDGPLYKKLRIGQVLSVAGPFVTFALLVI